MTRRELLALAALAVPGSRLDVHGSTFAIQGSALRTLKVGVARTSGGYSVSAMPVEKYVSSVLAGEALRGSAPAALEALAIAIRTYAAANLGRHRSDGFDLCDQTHCQVLRPATAATDRASDSTAGRLLLSDGAPASIFFSASCGGHTEKPSDVWPGADDPPYLPSRGDEACQGAPAWTADIQSADLLRALRAVGFRGDRLDRVSVGAFTSSGRVGKLRLDGLQPGEISGQDLRVAVGRTLGWQFIKSTAFELRRLDDRYRFTGHGSGHGVGLCVIGSARLAEQGRTAEQILARYFPGLALGGSASARPSGRAAATSIYVPPGDEGEQAALTRQTERARDEIAKALGVAQPARLTVRFHPTAAAYERATGASWFTSGLVIDGDLHLLPLAVLRERGILDRTIRRGLVHLMTDSELKSKPAWIREGAALYFGEPRAESAPAGRVQCPDDNELLKPTSAGALSNAYARARACFARQIDAGRSWKDVR